MKTGYGCVMWAFAQAILGQCIRWNVASSGSTSAAVARQCSRNMDCEASLGQSCQWLYEGCLMGQCMCDPHKHRQEDDGRCTPLKYGNQQCQEKDVCQEGMECREGRCQCTEGSLTSDRQYCLRPNEKLLGQRCQPSSDSCLHKSAMGYTRYEVRCTHNSECECDPGYKADGITCKKRNIHEYGCTRSIHCEGGALCDEGVCLCPPGYKAIAGNSKCAKEGAIRDLPRGASCDEINERRYCAPSFVCLRCPDDNQYKCVKFLMSNKYAFLWSGSTGSKLSFSATTTCLISTAIFLLACFCIISCYEQPVQLTAYEQPVQLTT